MSDLEDQPGKEQKQFDERLERQGGVFLEPDAGRRLGVEEGEGGTGQDDLAEDAYVGEDRPGTVDDVPYSMGTQEPDADDLHLVPEGGTHTEGTSAPEEETEQDPARRDERELWSHQRQLIEEDEDDGIKLEGLSEEQAKRVVDAMGDEAADPLSNWPDGTSATGAGNEPAHGGFPERE